MHNYNLLLLPHPTCTHYSLRLLPLMGQIARELSVLDLSLIDAGMGGAAANFHKGDAVRGPASE